MKTAIRNTIDLLKHCRKMRKAGGQGAYTSDANWLVNMAINRKAGWLDDPTEYRGSCMPVPVRQVTANGAIVIRKGKYPPIAAGRFYSLLRLVAHEVNS